MVHVIIDPGLTAKLEESCRPLTFCDTSGRVLGTFYPHAAEADYEAVEQARPKLTQDEIERRRQGPTYNTSEVIKRLESL